MSDTIRLFGQGYFQNESPPAEISARRAVVEAVLVEDYRRIFGFLVSRLRNADDARDVMQDFALRAIKRSDGLRNVESVRGWLRRLLLTAIADHHRRSSRRHNRESPVVATDEFTDFAEQSDADVVVCACLSDVIGLLAPAAADLVRRIDLEEQPRSDVARALNISEGTLAVRLHRARAKLRALLVAMCLTCPEHGFLDCACDRARTLRQAAGNLALDTAM